jgi:hypothetical protein
MAEPVTIEELAEAMFNLVRESAGSRRLRPTEVTKAMVERFGADRCSRDACKEAMKRLTESGRLVYTFYDGSYVELPSEERKGEGSD